MTITGAILARITLVGVITMMTAAGHGHLKILMAGKVTPRTAVASMIPYLIQPITSMVRLVRVREMDFATLWIALMSHTAVSLMKKEILFSGLVTQLIADVIFGAEKTLVRTSCQCLKINQFK